MTEQSGNVPAGNAPAFYKPELDVIRLLAFLMVFFHHVFPRDIAFFSNHVSTPVLAGLLASVGNSLAFGLPLFFMLSAYLITTLFIIEWRTFGSIDLKSFYIRRMLRIWPLMYLGLAIGLAYAFLWGHSDHYMMLVFYSLFAGNFYFIDHSSVHNPAVPLWSLSLEEQFYLVFPIAIILLSRKAIPVIALLLILASVVSLYVMGESGMNVDERIWTSALSQAIFFGSGILLAFATADRRLSLPGSARLLLLNAAFALLLAVAFLTEAKYFGTSSSGLSVSAGYVGAAIACVCIILALLDASWKFPRWAVYLGKISFGLYVFHALYLMMIGSLVSEGAWKLQTLALIPTIATAMLSYHFYEKPFLRLRGRFALVTTRTA